MANIIVDIEADGPVPGLYSMVSFGAVVLDDKLNRTFYGKTKPISDRWIPEALAVSGHSREEHLNFDDPKKVMTEFKEWLLSVKKGNRLYFWSDNNGFDFAFINYYFHLTLGENPFGWSSQNLNSFYKGLVQDRYASFKKLRTTKHTHNPVDDAMGVAEAMDKIQKLHNYRF